jgi:hypothetical protein
MKPDDDLNLDLPLMPPGLLACIDTIRQLRADADAEEDRDQYDPCGYTRDRTRAMRAHADKLEAAMEQRLGWIREGQTP